MHVIHATDFSEASEVAFAHALALALVHRARLTLLHVGRVPSGGIDWGRFPGVRPRLTAWGLLPEVADKRDVAARLGVEVEKLVFDGGNPTRTIVNQIDASLPDFLVLAHRGRGAGLGPMRRSVSQAIARAALVPTLVVPDGVRGFVALEDGSLRLERVLVAVDTDPDPRAAIARAARLIGDLAADGSAVELLHLGAEADAPAIPDEDLPRAKVTRASRAGDPAAEIATRATEIDADLVVLATAGRSGLGDALHGSVTERVLARTTTPVLAVPAG